MFTWRQHVTACRLVEIHQYFGETYGPTEPESSLQTPVDFHSTNDHIPADKITQLWVLDLLLSLPKAWLYTYVVHTYKRLCRMQHKTEVEAGYEIRASVDRKR